MKPTTLLLAASLIANVALVAVVATRSAAPAPGTATTATPATPARSDSAALRAALASGDATALQAAGLSADLSREIALSRSLTRSFEKIRAAKSAATADGRWWRAANSGSLSREQQLLLRREFTDALAASFGDDLGLFSPIGDAAQLDFLSPDKRAALRRITQDYAEMMAKFSPDGVQLASDKEKLRLLRSERDRDIAALLSPSELADYELRTSPSAATVRNRYGDAIQSEDDFRKLYALQKAFDEKFPAEALTGRVSMDTMRARADAQQQLQTDIRATLGDEKYAALRRATDSELRTLDGLVTRLGLPANTTDRLATARETYAAESQRINANATLSPTDRRAQLQDLGTKAKAELTSALGAEAAEAFAPRASWVGMLQGGIAFSTTPVANSPGSLSLAGGATQSVYPVMPAGTPGAGTPGVRQIVNVISSSTENTNSGGGTLFFSGTPVERPPGTTQVISVGTSTTTHGDTPTTTTVTPAPAPTPKP